MRALDAAMTEDDLLTAIVEAAQLLGWAVHHDRRSDRALQMGSAGFPDLVLAKRGRVLFWECKGHSGAISQEQWAWMMHLGYEPADDPWSVRVIRPADLDDALAELAR